MSDPKHIFAKFFEDSGLDWIPLILCGKEPPDGQLPYPSSMPEIQKQFTSLTDETKLDYALEQCDDLVKREEDRADKIESKAFTLTGASGIAVSLIVGFAGLLLDQAPRRSPFIVLVAVFFILVVVALMLTLYLALKVVRISAYTYPSPDDIFGLSTTSIKVVKRERVSSLFYSFAQNTKLDNRKGTYLIGAEIWFKNSITLLMCLTLLLGVNAIFEPFGSVQTGIVVQPTPTTSIQNSPVPTPSPVVTTTNMPPPPVSTMTP